MSNTWKLQASQYANRKDFVDFYAYLVSVVDNQIVALLDALG